MLVVREMVDESTALRPWTRLHSDHCVRVPANRKRITESAVVTE